MYYKEIYEEVLNIAAHLVVLLTGGRALRWVCNGYLSGDGLRERMLDSTMGAQFISGIVVGTMPTAHRRTYDRLMDLYLQSDQSDKAEKLDQLLDEYSRQHG